MKLLLAGILAAGLLGAPPASANPGPTCNLQVQQLCDPSRVYFCPSTGAFVSFMGYCPALVTGVTPPQPGGLTSDGGLAQ
jgi:hypothetical protein